MGGGRVGGRGAWDAVRSSCVWSFYLYVTTETRSARAEWNERGSARLVPMKRQNRKQPCRLAEVGAQAAPAVAVAAAAAPPGTGELLLKMQACVRNILDSEAFQGMEIQTPAGIGSNPMAVQDRGQQHKPSHTQQAHPNPFQLVVFMLFPSLSLLALAVSAKH